MGIRRETTPVHSSRPRGLHRPWYLAGLLALTLGGFVPATAAAAAPGAAPDVESEGAAFRVPPDTVTTFVVDRSLTGRGNIGGVAVDALGFLYVANFREAVWRISPDGAATLLSGAQYGSSGNAVDRRGDLYQANFNADTITRIRRTGEVEVFASEGLSGPVGLAFDEAGDLFVCNCTGGTISRVTPDGEVSQFAKSPLLACPNGITRDDRGDLYVVSFNGPDVVRITPDGVVHTFARITGAGGNGHIAFARGSLFVTQLRGHAVYRVSRDGSVSLVAGDGTREVRDGPADRARFSFPNGIAADPRGQMLWVNDLVGPYNGNEPTEIVLRRVRLVTLADVLTGALEGVASEDQTRIVRDVYAAYAEAKPGDDTRGDAVRIGYVFLSTRRIGAAVTLFELNAASHPDNAPASFHLGEAYRFTGRAEEAIARYERALELDPSHPQAAARLALVRGD